MGIVLSNSIDLSRASKGERMQLLPLPEAYLYLVVIASTRRRTRGERATGDHS